MASAKTFALIVAKVNEQLYRDEAVSVTLPGVEGELTVLAHHAPLITLLKQGTITVKDGEGTHAFPLVRGVLEISNNRVTVLVQE